MKNYIKDFDKAQVARLNTDRGFKIPDFKAGDTVNVKYKIVEGTNSRIQAFSGVVIARAKKASHYCATFTVRKMSSGIGVERNFTLYSPLIADIEVLKKGVVRRAKLYYLRDLTGKASRIKEKLDFLSKDKRKEAAAKAAAKEKAVEKAIPADTTPDKEAVEVKEENK